MIITNEADHHKRSLANLETFLACPARHRLHLQVGTGCTAPVGKHSLHRAWAKCRLCLHNCERHGLLMCRGRHDHMLGRAITTANQNTQEQA